MLRFVRQQYFWGCQLMFDPEIERILQQLPEDHRSRMRAYTKQLGVREGDIVFPLMVILENYMFQLQNSMEQVREVAISEARSVALATAQIESARLKVRSESLEEQLKEGLREFIQVQVGECISATVRETIKPSVDEWIAEARSRMSQVQVENATARVKDDRRWLIFLAGGVIFLVGVGSILGWQMRSVSFRWQFNGLEISQLEQFWEWNADRWTKCQNDLNPKCTFWISPPK